MIYGVDIHPQYQAGISIEQISAEGFDFMAAKVSQGTTKYNSADWFRTGRACGLLCLGYHYLEPGNEVAQAQTFAEQLGAAGVPGMLDVEYPLPNGDTLTIAGIRRFLSAATGFGATIPLIYFPRWYWQRMGAPDLTGLPRLWASSYVGGSAAASTLFESVTPRYWAPYGGLPVSVLQFTDQAQVAGRCVDGDAYPGTRSEFQAMISSPRPLSATLRRRVTMCYRLDPTPLPPGAGPVPVPDGTWGAVEDTITTPGPAGGWSGRIVMHLTFGYRGGFIQEAWSGPSGKHFVARFDPKARAGGQFVPEFTTQHWELPTGDDKLVVRYSTLARGSVATETEH